MDKIIKPVEYLRGEIGLPGDKSISHRVVFIGGISKGMTRGKNFLRADDCLRTIYAFRDMGIDIELKDKNITIAGNGLRGLQNPDKELYMGNSGTTMRILPGILAGQDFEVTLTGDESLSKRPMNRIMEPLRRMGVDIHSKTLNGFPPLVIKGGKIRPITCSIETASAQVKSCILFAGLYSGGTTCVTEPFISRDHTERMLKESGARITRSELTVSIEGERELSGKEFFIPGDISSAAFFIAGACILEGSDITIRDVGTNPTRLGFINTLLSMGAEITICNKRERPPEPYGDIRVKFTKTTLKSTRVKKEEVPLLIDEVPILAVVSAFAEGKTIIEGVSELRVKETDRILSMTENLKRMGVDIRFENERLVINGNKRRFKKAKISSFGDHRTAMSMAIAGLAADGDSLIENTDCVDTSFPEFFQVLECLKK